MKKLLVLLAMFIIVIALVTACRRDDEEDPGATPAPGNGGDVTVEPEPEPTMYSVHTPRDLGGRVILMVDWWNSLGDPLTPPDPATASNYPVARQQYENNVRFRRDFNVELEILITGGYGEMIPMLTTHHLAGDPLGDWVNLSGPMVITASRGGMILPVSAFAPPGSDILGAQNYVVAFSPLDGEYWSFGGSSLYGNTPMIGINLDIINALGAPNPVDLFYAGQWTWDAFLDIMRQARLAGYHGIATWHTDIVMHMMAANDAYWITPDFQYNFGSPAAMAAMDFFSIIMGPERLWHYDISDPDNLWDWGRNFSSWADGSVVFWQFLLWNAQEHFPLAFEWDIVPFPLGPHNTSGNSWSRNFPGGWTIPVHVPNPEDVFIIFEEREAWAWGDLELLHEEAPFSWWRSGIPTEEAIQRKAGAAMAFHTELGRAIPGYGILGALAWNFWNQALTLTEIVESYRPYHQAILDDFFGN